MNNILKYATIIALTAICVLAAGCTMSSAEKHKGNELVSNQSDQFISQAILQYGKGTKVRNIRAETLTIYNPLFGIPSERKTTGSLAGDITVGKETFHGIYSPEIGQVFSDKNYEKILESAEAFFGLADTAVLGASLTDSAHEKYYLPDEINTFETMLENQYFMLIYVYTTTDLSRFTEEDFAKLNRFYEEYEKNTGHVVFVQLKDDSNLTALQRDINAITFEYENHHGTVYDNETHDYVDSFEKFGIVSSLYVGKKRFIYND